MRRNVALLVLACCCLPAAARPFRAGHAAADVKEKATLLAVGDAAPDWKLTDPRGRVHTLAEYRGKVVVMDFWATWCGPCARVMPRLEKLHRRYGEKNLAVFGVNTWENGDPVALMKKKGYTYGLLLKGEELAPTYGVKSIPVVYVIGPDGRVLYSHAGPNQKDLEALIAKHLATRDARPAPPR